jgi:hypothetical protein
MGLVVGGCSGDSAGPLASGPPASASAVAPNPAKDELAVRQSFDRYRTAALEKDGEAALAEIASTVYPFYDQARGDALTASDDQVRGLTVAEQLTIYVLRGSIEPEVLRTATPPELVVAAVEAGLVGEQGVQNTDLGEVEVLGNTASGQVLSNGQPSRLRFSFVREDGRWKLDLLPVLQLANGAFAGLAKEQGTTVNELIDQLLQSLYGPTKARDVRSPVDG